MKNYISKYTAFQGSRIMPQELGNLTIDFSGNPKHVILDFRQ